MRFALTVVLALALTAAPVAGQWRIDRAPTPQATTAPCQGQNLTLPFDDVTGIFFCSIASVYFTGLTAGTSGTTFSPDSTVTRAQMAAFLSGTMSQSVSRRSLRLALGQNWLPHTALVSDAPITGLLSGMMVSDGKKIYVPTSSGITTVDATTLATTDTFYGDPVNGLVVVAGSLVSVWEQYITFAPLSSLSTGGNSSIGAGGINRRVTFDGTKFWIAGTSNTYTFSLTAPPTSLGVVYNDFLFDGANVWATSADNTIKKLDSNGAVLQSVGVGTNPQRPVFDGANIWVPNKFSNNVTVIRASTGAVLATLAPAGMGQPNDVAFDGERVAVVAGTRIYLFRATDLSLIANRDLGKQLFSVTSDGAFFFVAIDDNTDTVKKF